jgi:hypothetical protein
MTPTPVGIWSCPLPDEGKPSESAPGPCAAKVMSEKIEDVGRASRPNVDSKKTLITAQGPDRSVQNSSTTPTNRLINDLQKSTHRSRRSSSIPRPITTTNFPNIETQTFNTLNSAPELCLHSVPQRQRQPLNEEDAGRQPVASLSQRSLESQPAEPQEGAAQQNRPANQSKGLLLGGPRPHRNHQPPRPNLASGEKNISNRYLKPPNEVQKRLNPYIRVNYTSCT